ncbi:hypothetical protein MYAM1_000888 [Malassezia yamatoensis]|uniref:F-box domain-containing protein n=1 Tax=Malassezia yamatoensis TaxID=253288 RepID=A0AAJ5YPL3_9BASI|nr:hypothetical protein MYAM1_000888 [Malassezia yamatoensis]
MLETIHAGTLSGGLGGDADAGSPPKLPMNVLKEVALCLVAVDSHPRRCACRLALTCRAWFVLLYGQILLPRIVLRGEIALRQFAFSISRKFLGLEVLVRRHTRCLFVLQVSDSIQSEALFDGVVKTRRFGMETKEVMRMILRRCTSLQSLYMQCEPLALDLRDGAVGLDSTRASLNELVCLQSPWAGDAIDEIWSGAQTYGAWKNLSYLQLHGPRSRISVRTADALAQLPSLTHLALIMPSFMGAYDSRNSEPVLAAIVAKLDHLQNFLIVGHDEENWVGATRHLRPALERLRVTEQGRNITITLVTAHFPRNDSDIFQRIHPGKYSEWMLQRAMTQTHWDFGTAEDQVHFVTEKWSIPYAAPSTQTDTHPLQETPTDAADQLYNDLPMNDDDAWFDAQEPDTESAEGPASMSTSSSVSSALWGIDNLS